MRRGRFRAPPSLFLFFTGKCDRASTPPHLSFESSKEGELGHSLAPSSQFLVPENRTGPANVAGPPCTATRLREEAYLLFFAELLRARFFVALRAPAFFAEDFFAAPLRAPFLAAPLRAPLRAGIGHSP